MTLQALLTASGLTLDFAGFCMLLREWWVAFLSEQALMAHEVQLEQQQKLRAFSSQSVTNEAMKRHMAVAGQMQDDLAIRKARDARKSALAGRRFWFLSATALIVAGFLLQLAGALPLEFFNL